MTFSGKPLNTARHLLFVNGAHCALICSVGSPGLLALQQFAVGGDFDVQGQLGVHQVLVLSRLAGHVLLRLSQSLFQVLSVGLGVLDGLLAVVLAQGDGVLEICTLEGEDKEEDTK